MESNLKGHVALVTGGYRGLGKNICLGLASEGLNVAINYRHKPEETEAIIKEIKEKYSIRAIKVKGDVTVENDVKSIFKTIIDEYGKIDVLINNAAICPTTMIKDTSLEEWKNVINTNLTGVFLTCREMVNYLLDNNLKGKIINVASQAAYNGSKNGKTAYATSKGGVVSFTHSLAKEISRYGINVNAVAPGLINTAMTAQLLNEQMEKYNREIPIGRIAQLDEITSTIIFLISDAASYITGATLDVSGGMIGR